MLFLKTRNSSFSFSLLSLKIYDRAKCFYPSIWSLFFDIYDWYVIIYFLFVRPFVQFLWCCKKQRFNSLKLIVRTLFLLPQHFSLKRFYTCNDHYPAVRELKTILRPESRQHDLVVDWKYFYLPSPCFF